MHFRNVSLDSNHISHISEGNVEICTFFLCQFILRLLGRFYPNRTPVVGKYRGKLGVFGKAYGAARELSALFESAIGAFGSMLMGRSLRIEFNYGFDYVYIFSFGFWP
jgi:hypothetical protein